MVSQKGNLGPVILGSGGDTLTYLAIGTGPGESRLPAHPAAPRRAVAVVLCCYAGRLLPHPTVVGGCLLFGCGSVL